MPPEAYKSNKRHRILYLAPDSKDAEWVLEQLGDSGLGHSLTRATSLAEGEEALQQGNFDLVLVDLTLPDGNGLEQVPAIGELASEAAIVALLDAEQEKIALKVLEKGAHDFLFKSNLKADLLEHSIRCATTRVAALKPNKENYRQALMKYLFDGNEDAMLILGPNSEILSFNPAAAELLEAGPESLVGEVFPFSVRAGDRTELEIPGPGGSTRMVVLDAVAEPSGKDRTLLVTLRDVTDRRKTEQALLRKNKWFAGLMAASGEGIITTDRNGSVTSMNKKAEELTGCREEDVVGRPLPDALRLKVPSTGETVKNPEAVLLSRNKKRPEREKIFRIVRESEEDPLVHVSMQPIADEDSGRHGCLALLRLSCPHEGELEEKRFKEENLRTISLLAGGIAHDFNNLLSAIIGNISVCRLDMESDNPQAEKLKAAENAALQAQHLTRQLLTFSKGGAPVVEATAIDQLVDSCVQFILRGSNVRCEVRKSEDLWDVDVDGGQIGQVINNLVINASQAMPEGGVIDVEMSNVSLNPDELPPLEAGDYVCISVADKGCGISESDLGQIFTPYFTTKEQGSGLGLSSARTILNNHGGHITATSTPGEGSTFWVYLPRASAKSREAAKPQENVSEDASDFPLRDKSRKREGKKGGRILVMDDMEPMMLVAGEIIGVLGYDVEFAHDGEEAIRVYKKAKEAGVPFDAVVFDLTVPGGMGGEEACGILREYDPDLVAIASSGYTTSTAMVDYREAGFQAVVPKPYRIKEMRTALTRVLGGV
ncbi:MAG: response regulator [Opitutales bacterium]